MNKIKQFLIKFLLQGVAFVVCFILTGAICRSIYDLFMLGYNLGH